MSEPRCPEECGGCPRCMGPAIELVAASERDEWKARAEKAESIACAFAVPAVRYATGRRTYVVGDVCHGVSVLLPGLSHAQVAAIVREIDAARDLGAPHDRDHWMALRSECARHLQREAE